MQLFGILTWGLMKTYPEEFQYGIVAGFQTLAARSRDPMKPLALGTQSKGYHAMSLLVFLLGLPCFLRGASYVFMGDLILAPFFNLFELRSEVIYQASFN